MYASGDRKCHFHFQGHVTLTYKVTRQGLVGLRHSTAYIPFPPPWTSLTWGAVWANVQGAIQSGLEQQIPCFTSAAPSRERKPYSLRPRAHNNHSKKISKRNDSSMYSTKAEIESVTFKVTWPWRTRSPVKATILAKKFIFRRLTFLSGKTLETEKKNYCSSVYTSEDKNAVKSVMTSWRQVTTS